MQGIIYYLSSFIILGMQWYHFGWVEWIWSTVTHNIINMPMPLHWICTDEAMRVIINNLYIEQRVAIQINIAKGYILLLYMSVLHCIQECSALSGPTPEAITYIRNIFGKLSIASLCNIHQFITYCKPTYILGRDFLLLCLCYDLICNRWTKRSAHFKVSLTCFRTGHGVHVITS